MKYLVTLAFILALIFQQYTLQKTFELNTALQVGIMRNLDIVEWACIKKEKRK